MVLLFIAVFVLGSINELTSLSIMVVQLPVTVLIIAYEITNPYYHGVYARKINPHLDEYLKDEI